MTELILTTESDGIIDIQMNRPPVNALNLELVEALHQEIDSHTNNGAKGLMLSGREGIYSAGLDVKNYWRWMQSKCQYFLNCSGG